MVTPSSLLDEAGVEMAVSVLELVAALVERLEKAQEAPVITQGAILGLAMVGLRVSHRLATVVRRVGWAATQSIREVKDT